MEGDQLPSRSVRQVLKKTPPWLIGATLGLVVYLALLGFLSLRIEHSDYNSLRRSLRAFQYTLLMPGYLLSRPIVGLLENVAVRAPYVYFSEVLGSGISIVCSALPFTIVGTLLGLSLRRRWLLVLAILLTLVFLAIYEFAYFISVISLFD